jgi:TonB-linked SusC/RagA family outer membrane protein
MRRFFTLFVVLIFSGILASAQNRTISGQVRDVQGATVPFVTVTETGTKNAVTTDANGNFSIKVKQAAASLTFSVVGYDPVTMDATGNNVAVSLKRNTQELAAVVVTALGQQRQAKELGYSTAKVKAPELTQGKVVNLQNGLTGKVSGLNIQTVNNGVFADTRITLRGIRSLTGNNQPMLVLDGVPIALSFISSINPNDIADVVILKSSSSTAIYGPDGVNGAIIITTKRGSKSNPTVTLSHTTQLERVSFMPLFQSQFGSGSSETATYEGVYDPIENQGYGDAFDGTLRQIGRDGPGGIQQKYTYEARPNEKKNFWNTGVTNQTDLSISTGDFYLSFQNVDIKGIMPKDENKRVSVHMSANKEFGSKLKASYSVQYTQSNYNVNAGSSFGNGRDYSPYWNLINSPMQIPITNFKNWQSDYWSSPDGFYNDYYYNPYWTVDNFRQKGRNDNLLGNIEFNYKIAPWINLTYRLGATYFNTTSKATQGSYKYSKFAKASGKSNAADDLVAAVSDFSNYSSRLNSEIFATLRKEYGRFKFDALLGQSFRETNLKNQSNNVSALGIPGLFNSSARAVENAAFELNTKTRLERFFGKVSVGYNNWAFVEFTGSNDIDSRLANPYDYDFGKISFFYPGVSTSLVLSEAIPAIKNSRAISYLKVRGAISKTGNVNLPAYSLENTYSQTNGFPYGNLIGLSSDNTLRQSSYEPEFVKNQEVGLEVGFLKNRINFEATAYKQDNSNQIIQVAYSATTGYPNALLNAADFTNKGLEFDLKLTPLIKINKLSIDFKVNYTYQTNEVTKLIDGVDELGIGNGNFIIKGQPAYTFKLTDYERDDFGRVKVSSSTGYPTPTSTAKMFGQTLPKHILGLNLNASYRGLSFSVVADYRGGNQIYSGIGPDMDFSGISYRSGQNGRQPFIFPNSVIYDPIKDVYVENTSVYTLSGGYNFWSQARNTTVNSNYLASGAFWKLREVALTYTFPATLFSKKGLKGASISFTGRNLFTWLPKTNEWTDPEFSNTTGNAQGVNDRDNTPPTRIFGANVTLQF